MSNMEDETWLNIQYLNICFKADNYKQEMDAMINKNKMEVFSER